MKILKKPDCIIFDTENPGIMEFNTTPSRLPHPLHHITLKTDWDFLSGYFKSKQGVKHPIFKDFDTSYYFCLEI